MHSVLYALPIRASLDLGNPQPSAKSAGCSFCVFDLCLFGLHSLLRFRVGSRLLLLLVSSNHPSFCPWHATVFCNLSCVPCCSRCFWLLCLSGLLVSVQVDKLPNIPGTLQPPANSGAPLHVLPVSDDLPNVPGISQPGCMSGACSIACLCFCLQATQCTWRSLAA